MRIRSTVILFGVLVGLLTIILLTEEANDRGRGEGGGRDPSVGTPLLALLADPGGEVTEISWGAGDRKTTVRRSGSGERWNLLVANRALPCEGAEVEEILMQARRCLIKVRIPVEKVSAGARKDYWLAPPGQWIEVEVDGRRERAFLGANGAGRDRVYACRKPDQDVYLVDSGLAETLRDMAVDGLRRRRILDWSVTEVRGVTIREGGRERFRASRTGLRDPWRAQAPFADFLDPLVMDRSVIPEFVSLKAEEFVLDGARTEDLAAFGLAKPRFAVAIRRAEDRGGGTRTLLVGGDVPGKAGRVYLMEEGEPFVYSCRGTALLGVLGADPATWRDRNLLRVGDTPLTRFALELGETAFEVRSSGERWRLEKPERMDLEQKAVEALLEGLRRLEVDAFLDEADAAALGLVGDSVAGEMSFWTPAGGTEEVIAAVVVSRRREGGLFAMRKAEPDRVLVLGGALEELLAKGYLPLKRREIFYDVDFVKREAVRIRQERKDGPSVEISTVDGRWPEETDVRVVGAVEKRLTGLTALDWVGPAEGREDEYGFTEGGEVTVRMWFRRFDGGDEALEEYGVILGGEAENGRYALGIRNGRVEPDVFVVPLATVRVFEAPIR